MSDPIAEFQLADGYVVLIGSAGRLGALSQRMTEVEAKFTEEANITLAQREAMRGIDQ